MINWKLQAMQVPHGVRFYYWHATVTRHKLSQMQGQTLSFDLFAEIGLKAFFQPQSHIQNIKNIYWQPKVVFRNNFRHSARITIQKVKKICSQRYCPKDSRELKYASAANTPEKMHLCQKFYLSYLIYSTEFLSFFLVIPLFPWQPPLTAPPASIRQQCLKLKQRYFFAPQNYCSIQQLHCHHQPYQHQRFLPKTPFGAICFFSRGTIPPTAHHSLQVVCWAYHAASNTPTSDSQPYHYGDRCLRS